MASKIAARYISRRLLSSGKILSKEEKAAENIYIKGLTKRIGQGTYEWAAKVDEFARGMLGPPGSTLFEELGLYYIGPVDGHNIDDLLCVLNQVASLDTMGPVLIHIVTKEDQGEEDDQRTEIFDEYEDGMAEQHAVTFSAGLSRGGLKPFCIIPSTFLQRAYDQVVHDVDQQNIPVRFAITSAGLVGSDGSTHCGAFDITFTSCLPNMIVMAPSDEYDLVNMIATASEINDRPVCFRYPIGAIVNINNSVRRGVPLEIGKGRILKEGEDVAFFDKGLQLAGLKNRQPKLIPQMSFKPSCPSMLTHAAKP